MSLGAGRDGRCVDVHCHCLPGLDDGPATLADALDLCRALAADGVHTVVATPHQLGRYDRRNDAATLRPALDGLRAALAAASVPLTVELGADVRVDERLVPLLAEGHVLGLGPTGRHVLLELPHDTLVDLRGLIADLASAGRLAVVSHPERQAVLARRPDLVLPWLEAGASLQLTAGSLVGAFGLAAEAAAWHWLARGQAHLVATDAHDPRSRPPLMTAARAAIRRRLGPATADLVCVDNPARVLAGEPVVAPAAVQGATPPAPTRRRGGWFARLTQLAR